MASLSNINGIFDVHSTGAILFSTSHGTSGQILRSNGNAAPTWVAASTVIGGPYLPLTGGTLTGPLSGTSATFSGNVACGNTAGTNTGVRIYYGAGTGSYGSIRFYSNAINTNTIHVFSDTWQSGTIFTKSSGAINIDGNTGVTFGAWNLVDVAFKSGGPNYFRGNVGIGTTSPDAKLEIATLRQPGIRLSSLDTTAATNELLSGIEFYTPDISAPRVSSYINCNFTSAYGDSYLTFATSTGVGAATERMRITDYGSLVVGNTPGTNSNWGKIQCGGTITVGNSSGTYVTHGRISGDSDGMKLKGTSTGTYSNPQGVTINGYNVGINTDSPNVGNAYGLVIRSFTNPSRLVFWNNTSGEVSSRGQRISFENANCIFENMESGYYAFKTGGSGANPSERARFNNVGQLLINATTSGYSTNNYGYMLGVRGTTSQAVISVAKSNQTLDTQGVLFGLSNSEAFIVNRDNTPLRFHTNNVPTMTILANGDVGIGTTGPSEKLHVDGNIAINDRIIGNSKNYATSQGWLPGAAGTFSSQIGYYGGNFNNNGSSSENSVIWGNSPFGTRALQWQTIGESLSNADGGWNKNIDNLPDGNTHAYMSYVYVKRTSSATTGTFYYGCNQVLRLNGTVNTNPYFIVANIGSLPQDVWCVAIGVIQAYTDNNVFTPSIVGVYRVDNGQKLFSGTGYRSQSGVQTTQSHRTYHYYSTDPAANLAFANPGFYVIDGTEPKLNTLVS